MSANLNDMNPQTPELVPPFGELVRFLRENRICPLTHEIKRLTREELCQNPELGLKVPTIEKIEQGDTKNSYKSTLEKLARGLGLEGDQKKLFMRSPRDSAARKSLYESIQSALHEVRYVGPDLNQLITTIREHIGLTRTQAAMQGSLGDRAFEWAEIETFKGTDSEHLNQIIDGLGLYEHVRNKLLKAVKLPTFAKREDAYNEILNDVQEYGAYYAPLYRPLAPPIRDGFVLIGRDCLKENAKDTLLRLGSIAFHGPEGIGKTALAKDIAKELTDEFRGGQAYISLRGCKETQVQWKFLIKFYSSREFNRAEVNGGEVDVREHYTRDEDTKSKDWLEKQFRFENKNGVTIDDHFLRTFPNCQNQPNDRRLIIVEDVEEIHIPTLRDILDNYFEYSRVILISNKNVFTEHFPAAPFAVGPLEIDKAVELLHWKNDELRKNIADSRSVKRTCETLAQRLTCHPLSLFQANCLIRSPQKDFPPKKLVFDIESLIKNQGSEGKTKSDKRVASGQLVLFEQIYKSLLKQSTHACKAFRQLSAFAEFIPIIPKNALLNIWHDTPNGRLSDQEYDELCEQMEQVGLIDRTEGGDIQIHSLCLHYATICMDDKGDGNEKYDAQHKHAKYYEHLAAQNSYPVNDPNFFTAGYQFFAREKENFDKARRFLLNNYQNDDELMNLLVSYVEQLTYPASVDPASARAIEQSLQAVEGNKHFTIDEKWRLLQEGNAQALQGKQEEAKETYQRIVLDLHQREYCTNIDAAALIGIANCMTYQLFKTAQHKNTIHNEDTIKQITNLLEQAKVIAKAIEPSDRRAIFHAHISCIDVYLHRVEDEARGANRDALKEYYLAIANRYCHHARALFHPKHRSLTQAQKLHISDQRLLAVLERKVGDIYAAEGNVEDACDHYQKSRDIAEEIDYKIAIYFAYEKEAALLRKYGYQEDAQNLQEEAKALWELALSSVGSQHMSK